MKGANWEEELAIAEESCQNLGIRLRSLLQLSATIASYIVLGTVVLFTRCLYATGHTRTGTVIFHPGLVTWAFGKGDNITTLLPNFHRIHDLVLWKTVSKKSISCCNIDSESVRM